MCAQPVVQTIIKLKGLVALVTGGTQRFGQATAERFVREGAKVVLCDSDVKGEEVAKKLGCVFCKTDITSPEEVTKAVATAYEKFGKLDIVVNCANVTAKPGLIFDPKTNTRYPLEEFRRVVMTNAGGTYNVIRIAARQMNKNKPGVEGHKGVIINMAPFSEEKKGRIADIASTGVIVGFDVPVARDLAECGIRVNTVCPGNFAGGSGTAYNRQGQPDEFAHACQMLVENPFMNATILRIHGGKQLHI